jgi:flavoprotein
MLIGRLMQPSESQIMGRWNCVVYSLALAGPASGNTCVHVAIYTPDEHVDLAVAEEANPNLEKL